LINTGAVENAALNSFETISIGNNSSSASWEGKDQTKDILISNRAISPEFISTAGMSIVEGRDFRINSSDSNNVLITEGLAAMMGKGSAIGKKIEYSDRNYEVVGVVADYVYGDMYGKSDPVMFFCFTDDARFMYVRLKSSVKTEEALAKLETVMKAANPAYPFQYSFVDEQFNARFKSESLIGKLSRVFAGLAILISCIGLFGLAAYTAERRRKEIGIRKILGAGTAGITALLSKDFLVLVAIASVIAFPIAWWSMNNWLQNYAYRIDINWWIFIVAAAIAMVIALATVSFQAIRAAIANPVKSLRTE
jgi:ABC-type antimicrobial peptide transport system permease subunit